MTNCAIGGQVKFDAGARRKAESAALEARLHHDEKAELRAQRGRHREKRERTLAELGMLRRSEADKAAELGKLEAVFAAEAAEAAAERAAAAAEARLQLHRDMLMNKCALLLVRRWRAGWIHSRFESAADPDARKARRSILAGSPRLLPSETGGASAMMKAMQSARLGRQLSLADALAPEDGGGSSDEDEPEAERAATPAASSQPSQQLQFVETPMERAEREQLAATGGQRRQRRNSTQTTFDRTLAVAVAEATT